MSVQSGKFLTLDAAADYLGTGAIEVNMYEKEIFDIVRRSSVALNRFPQVRASGHPHRYFEETAIATGAFTDPRSISPSNTGPTRTERTAYIKGIVAQSNLSIFDKDVTQQQGQFAYVVAKDIDDIISAIEVTRASAIWNGNDTSMSSPTTTQYMGLLNQITQQFTITGGSSIIDGLKHAVATMFANQTYKVVPTAIYVNPILGDHLDREARANQFTVDKMEVVGGVQVETLRTQAGILPIIGDAFLPSASGSAYGFSAPPSGYTNYFAVIVTEKLIEMPYISGEEDNPNPRLFQLGLTGNLQGQYVGIKFDAILAKGPSYAHAVVCVQLPTNT